MTAYDWKAAMLSSQDLVDTDSIMLAPEVSPDVHTIEPRPRSRNL